jgi:hypothetical protein
MIDYKRFKEICENIKDRQPGSKGIGTFYEKSLHAALKRYYEPDETKHEVRVEGYIADIYTGERIIEIQNGRLHTLKDKLTAFLDVAPVTVVYPIPIRCGVETVDGGEAGFQPVFLQRKKLSDFEESFIEELYSIRDFIGRQGLTVCTVRVSVIGVEHGRRPRKKKGSKRKTTRKIDTLPMALLSERVLCEPEDYLRLIPEGLAEPFTSGEYAKAASTALGHGRMMLNLLTRLGVLRHIGMRGRWRLYKPALSHRDFYDYDDY